MYNDINPEDERALYTARLEKLEEQRDAVLKVLNERETELRKINDQMNAYQTLLNRDSDAGPKPEHMVTKTPSNLTTTAPLEVAYQVLKEQSPADMHYKDLAEEVLKRGGHLPGTDPAALLNTRLTADTRKRFVRPYLRGTYALREDYPDLERSVGERRSRRPDVE